MFRKINAFRLLKVVLVFSAVALSVETVRFVRDYATRRIQNERPSGCKGKPTVHIIGKAAIADYLWLHILRGSTSDKGNGFYRTGTLETENFLLSFFSGPGYIQTTVPQEIEYLVLVLNGRSDKKRHQAKQWLDYLHNLPRLKKVSVVLLGDERCNNNWIIRFMRRHNGYIDALFVVYDWQHVNDVDIFQWPLGVATYRGFPLVDKYQKHPERKYVCNFAGTVYANSSRVQLLNILSRPDFSHKCATFGRNKWLANETPPSLHRYINLLNSSYFTLCPTGKNTECYRIYEAWSLGSIPIIEDVSTGGNCRSSLRLLKIYNAPVLYVRDWKSLDSLLIELIGKSGKISALQAANVLWYETFKETMKKKFLDVIIDKFELRLCF